MGGCFTSHNMVIISETIDTLQSNVLALCELTRISYIKDLVMNFTHKYAYAKQWNVKGLFNNIAVVNYF